MVKSWNDRLNTPGITGVKPTLRTIGDVVEGQPMLVPTARQDDDFIRSIPKGVEMDVRALRTALAIEHGAQVTCPVTIGYHLRTVAEAANEDLERGMTLNDRYSWTDTKRTSKPALRLWMPFSHDTFSPTW